ncbi:MAG TPA: hypothetical protein VF342_13120 [Alphaproteobacteria bacterium]
MPVPPVPRPRRTSRRHSNIGENRVFLDCAQIETGENVEAVMRKMAEAFADDIDRRAAPTLALKTSGKSGRKVVGATGIEPVTPTMSRKVKPRK